MVFSGFCARLPRHGCPRLSHQGFVVRPEWLAGSTHPADSGHSCGPGMLRLPSSPLQEPGRGGPERSLAGCLLLSLLTALCPQLPVGAEARPAGSLAVPTWLRILPPAGGLQLPGVRAGRRLTACSLLPTVQQTLLEK